MAASRLTPETISDERARGEGGVRGGVGGRGWRAGAADTVDPNALLLNRIRPPRLTSDGYMRAVGKRKAAVAHVDVKLEPPPVHASGEAPNLVTEADAGSCIVVNDTAYDEYFPELEARYNIMLPFRAVGLLKDAGATFPFHVRAHVHGGGRSGQAQAVKLGISRSLAELLPETRRTLKDAELLTRDPRVREEKKTGLLRARKAPQWSKR